MAGQESDFLIILPTEYITNYAAFYKFFSERFNNIKFK
jgi:hypothetical protein